MDIVHEASQDLTLPSMEFQGDHDHDYAFLNSNQADDLAYPPPAATPNYQELVTQVMQHLNMQPPHVETVDQQQTHTPLLRYGGQNVVNLEPEEEDNMEFMQGPSRTTNIHPPISPPQKNKKPSRKRKERGSSHSQDEDEEVSVEERVRKIPLPSRTYSSIMECAGRMGDMSTEKIRIRIKHEPVTMIGLRNVAETNMYTTQVSAMVAADERVEEYLSTLPIFKSEAKGDGTSYISVVTAFNWGFDGFIPITGLSNLKELLHWGKSKKDKNVWTTTTTEVGKLSGRELLIRLGSVLTCPGNSTLKDLLEGEEVYGKSGLRRILENIHQIQNNGEHVGHLFSLAFKDNLEMWVVWETAANVNGGFQVVRPGNPVETISSGQKLYRKYYGPRLGNDKLSMNARPYEWVMLAPATYDPQGINLIPAITIRAELLRHLLTPPCQAEYNGGQQQRVVAAVQQQHSSPTKTNKTTKHDTDNNKSAKRRKEKVDAEMRVQGQTHAEEQQSEQGDFGSELLEREKKDLLREKGEIEKRQMELLERQAYILSRMVQVEESLTQHMSSRKAVREAAKRLERRVIQEQEQEMDVDTLGPVVADNNTHCWEHPALHSAPTDSMFAGGWAR
jgi:hypothetical protein